MSDGTQIVIITGTLGKDPELSYTNNGMAICKFSVATSKVNANKDKKTSWHRCVAFGKTAETIAKFFGSGGMIYIEGELSYGQYEKDGIVRYTTDILVNRFSFLGKNKSDRQGQGQGQNQNNNYNNQGHGRGQQQNKSNSGNEDYDNYFSNPSDDDIPF